MSVSAYAKVVSGFPVYVKELKKEVTKYNEDTGESYKVKVPSCEVVVVNEKIELTETESEEYISEMGKFYLHGRDRENDEIGCVLGVAVAETSNIMYGSTQVEVDVDVPKVVMEFAKKHNLKPGLFLVGECSY